MILEDTCSPLCSGGICPEGNWSLYDVSPYNSEHLLMESHLCEIIDVVGYPIEYRVLLAEEDYLWGEDPNENLSDPVLTKVIYAPEQETAILDMFGISADDTIQYAIIPIPVFERDATRDFIEMFGPDVIVKPKVGDVITTLWNNRNYEIVNVSSEQTIFMAKKFTYEFILKPYRFSEQSDSHREVHTGSVDDPFSSIVQGPSGDIIQANYSVDNFGDNKGIEDESDTIHDYDTENDPDSYAFRKK